MRWILCAARQVPPVCLFLILTLLAAAGLSAGKAAAQGACSATITFGALTTSHTADISGCSTYFNPATGDTSSPNRWAGLANASNDRLRTSAFCGIGAANDGSTGGCAASPTTVTTGNATYSFSGSLMSSSSAIFTITLVSKTGTAAVTDTLTLYTFVGSATATSAQARANTAYSFTFNLPDTGTAAAPAVTGLSPTSGSTAGGTPVTITGTDLTGATAVRFGSTNAPGFVVNSTSSISVAAPAGSAGTVDVTVTTPGGTSATGAAGRFTYIAPPVAGAASATVAADSSANPIPLSLSGGTATSVTVATPAGHGTATAAGTAITYTPAAGYSGPDSFTYTATNAAGTSAAAAVTITVTAAPSNPTLSPAAGALPGAVTGTAYSQTVTATGGTAPYGYAVTAGALPAGLTLGPTTGALTGAPTAAGTANFTITATDSASRTGQAAYSLAVTAAPATISLSPAAGAWTGATAGTAYSQTVTATGGTAPYGYAVTAGALPAGLTLDPSSGTVSGTPTAAGPYGFTITATDSASHAGQAAYTLAVAAPLPPTGPTAIDLSPAAGAWTDAVAGAAYGRTVTAAGGAAPYRYAVTAGALPAGLALDPSSGTVSGTPAAAGTASFTITATDSAGRTGQAAYSLAVAAAPVSVGLSPPAGAWTSATVGTAYGRTVTAAGGTAPYRYAVTAGALPAGLVLDPSSGTVSGTPAAAGPYGFTITVTDAAGLTAQAAYTLAVATAPADISLSPAAGTWTAGTVGTAYGQTVTATGGTAPYRYAVTAGALPAGLVLDPSSGTVSGTPAAAGTASFTITATDGANRTGQAAYSLATALPSVAAVSSSTTVVAGSATTVDLTSGASGGPFTGARLLTLEPASAGTAFISLGDTASTDESILAAVVAARRFQMKFTPAPGFSGTAVATFTLSNATSTSLPATVTFVVVPRPDPARDPEVIGLINAQARAAQRFATDQIANLNERLEDLHGSGCQDSRWRLSFNDSRRDSPRRAAGPKDRPDVRTDAAAAADATDDAQTGRTISEPATALGAHQPEDGCGDAFTDRLAFWTGGSVTLGSTDLPDGRSVDFLTAGMSAGMDYRFGPSFIGGIGVGFGNDRSLIGSHDTRSTGRAYSVAVYGSYHPAPAVFIDALGGGSLLEFDSRRHVTAAPSAGPAHGQRDGRQVFGSLTAGYEHRDAGLLLAPYLRLTSSLSTLDGFTESGGGDFALAYGRQQVSSFTSFLGLRVARDLSAGGGVLTPRLRLEYAHDFAGASHVSLGYVDQPGTSYGLSTDPLERDYVTVNLGMDFRLQESWAFSLDYRTRLAQTDARQHGIGLRIGRRF